VTEIEVPSCGPECPFYHIDDSDGCAECWLCGFALGPEGAGQGFPVGCLIGSATDPVMVFRD
jgi:hypothetical protein